MTQLLARLLRVRDREVPAMMWAFAQMFCLLAGNYMLRPVRESLGSTRGSADYNWLYLGTFAATLVATACWSGVVARVPVRRFLTFGYEFFAVSFLVFWAVLTAIGDGSRGLAIGYAFFVWYSVYNIFVVSIFWSRIADLFSHDQGRRMFAVIAAGGSLGAITGSAITTKLATTFGTVNMLLGPVLLLQVVVFCSRRLASAAERLRESAAEEAAPAPKAAMIDAAPTSVWASFRRALRSPFLVLIAMYVLASTFCGTFVYSMQGEVAREAFPTRDDRTQYYGTIDFWVNVISFSLGLFVTGRIIGWIGVGAALFILPATYVLGFSFAGAIPVLVVVATLEIARRAAGYGITTPARETLFTVVSREEKYRAKNAIDTFVWRGGDVLAVWLLELVFWLGPGEKAPPATKVALMGFVGIPIAAVWLFIAARLRREHRAAAEAANPVPTTAP